MNKDIYEIIEIIMILSQQGLISSNQAYIITEVLTELN